MRANGVLLFALPLSAVLVVVLGVMSGGARPYRAARVYGGPSEGVAVLALRLEAYERERDAEAALTGTPFRLRALRGGRELLVRDGVTDELGMAELRLELREPNSGVLELVIEPRGNLAAPWARGLVLSSRRRFESQIKRGGGFVSGKHEGDIELAVAPRRGALVVAQGGMTDELVVRARRAGQALAALPIDVTVDGGARTSSKPLSVVTNELGLAIVPVEPLERELRLSLRAQAPDGASGSLRATLPVVQGAIRALLRQPGQLLLESTGAAEHAYVGFFDENGRLGGLHARLEESVGGRLSAVVPLPPAARIGKCWAVTSSQPDLASPAALGWPLGATSDGEPPTTLTAAEFLLVDGGAAAGKRETVRAERVRWLIAAYAFCALAGTLALFVGKVRSDEARIARHFRSAGLEAGAGLAPAKGGRVVLAAACIGLGFLVLALLALFKA